MTYKEIPLREYFKLQPDHVQYWRKVKHGRRVVAQPMTGGFTFYPPGGCKPTLKVYPCNSEGANA